MRTTRRILLLSLAALIALLLASGVANASAQYTVTTTADMGSSGECTTGGSCSLREAIADANANGGATIIVPGGTYLLDPEQGALSSSANTTLRGSTTSPTIIDGNQATQVLQVTGGTFTADAITIQNGKTQGNGLGGGLEVETGATVTLTDSVVTGNSTAELGGGIYDGGNLNLDDDVISDNTASSFEGGGLDVAGASATSTVSITGTTFSGNSAAYGGGIAVDLASDGDSSDTVVTVSDSAILSNHASESGGGYDDDDDSFPGSVAITNTTIADNISAGDGGGMEIGDTTDSQQFVNDTISGNVAAVGGDVYSGSHPSIVQNTIVAGGAATNSGPDCGGSTSEIDSLGHNLDDADGCHFTAAGDLVNTNPQLGSLQSNGGPTETLATALTSPAIDAGTTSGLGCPATDQRGVVRPQGAGCDIGAYESAPPIITNPGPTTVAVTSAGVQATVANPDLAAATVGVEWGPSAGDYTSSTPAQTVPASSAATVYGFMLSGLQPETTYHLVVVATTSRGSVTSADFVIGTGANPATTTTPGTPVTTAPLPSNRFTVSKLRVARTGKLTATLGAPDAGTFTTRATFSVTRKVAVRKHGKQVLEKRTTTFTYAVATVKVTKKSTHPLVLGLSRAAAAELKRLGSARVTVAVTFTPKGGKALTKRLTITVKRNPKGTYR